MIRDAAGCNRMQQEAKDVTGCNRLQKGCKRVDSKRLQTPNCKRRTKGCKRLQKSTIGYKMLETARNTRILQKIEHANAIFRPFNFIRIESKVH